MGYAPTHDTGNPILLVELTKQDLLQIAQRKDVEAIDNADIYRPIQNMDIPA